VEKLCTTLDAIKFYHREEFEETLTQLYENQNKFLSVNEKFCDLKPTPCISVLMYKRNLEILQNTTNTFVVTTFSYVPEYLLDNDILYMFGTVDFLCPYSI
jgi:hypothetical protein